MKSLLLFVLAVLVSALIGGCGGSRADVIQTRETMYLGTRTMRAEHIDWAKQLGPGGDLTKLPTLSVDDLALRKKWDKEMEDYVANSRKHDADEGFTFGGLLNSLNPFSPRAPPTTQP